MATEMDDALLAAAAAAYRLVGSVLLAVTVGLAERSAGPMRCPYFRGKRNLKIPNLTRTRTASPVETRGSNIAVNKTKIAAAMLMMLSVRGLILSSSGQARV